MEGITREQLKTLRKRAAPCRLEEDKWRDVYRLLFPDVLESDVPSPCKSSYPLALECQADLTLEDYNREMPTERSRQFRHDLLKMIRSELFSVARRATGHVEEHLLKQVAGIIQRCQTQLNSSRQATAHTTPSGTPQTSPQHMSQPLGFITPPPLQQGLLDPDSFFLGVTDDDLYHVDWNSLFVDPNNDIPSLSSAIANPQLFSKSSTSREVQMVGS